MRAALLLLALTGCATTAVVRPEPPVTLTFAWPQSLERTATFLVEHRTVDIDGEQLTRGSLSYREAIAATPQGFVVETHDAKAGDGDAVFRALATQHDATTALTSSGDFVSYERAKSARPIGVKAGMQSLGNRLADMIDEQLADDARLQWHELVGRWRGRVVSTTSEAWRDDEGAVMALRGVACTEGGATRCVRLHSLAETEAPPDAAELFQVMARGDATLQRATRRREFVLVTDPDTLVPWQWTVTDVTVLEGALNGAPLTFTDSRHIELQWTP